MVDRRRQWRAENQDISIKESLGANKYLVTGSRGIDYEVDHSVPRCDCPDWEKREPDGGCKHILYIKLEEGFIDPLPSAHTNFGNPDNRKSSNYSNWSKLSEQTKERDNWECQKCGREGGQFGPAELHAHHIVTKNRGGTDSIENLITVCRSCHEDVHGHTIPSENKSYSCGNVTQSGNREESNSRDELGEDSGSAYYSRKSATKPTKRGDSQSNDETKRSQARSNRSNRRKKRGSASWDGNVWRHPDEYHDPYISEKDNTSILETIDVSNNEDSTDKENISEQSDRNRSESDKQCEPSTEETDTECSTNTDKNERESISYPPNKITRGSYESGSRSEIFLGSLVLTAVFGGIAILFIDPFDLMYFPIIWILLYVFLRLEDKQIVATVRETEQKMGEIEDAVDQMEQNEISEQKYVETVQLLENALEDIEESVETHNQAFNDEFQDWVTESKISINKIKDDE